MKSIFDKISDFSSKMIQLCMIFEDLEIYVIWVDRKIFLYIN